MEPVKMPPIRKTDLKGLIIALSIFVFLAGTIVVLFLVNTNKTPDSKVKNALAQSTADPAHSAVLDKAVEKSGNGISAVVVPIPNSAASVAMVTMDTSQGFAPGTDQASVRAKIMEIAKNVIAANDLSGLGITDMGYTIVMNGKTAATVTVPMNVQEDWVNGKINDLQLYGKASIDLDNSDVVKNFVDTYLKNLF
jgi:hypothetical protein